MNKPPPPPLNIEELRTLHRERRDVIKARLAEFAAVPPSAYCYELIYCLLTPQSSAVSAGKAVRVLQEHDFFVTGIDPERLLHQKDFYIRFHKTKAKHLLACRVQFPHILGRLKSAAAGKELRAWLVANVRGLGWKEASHFLRNIGYRDLAILDRHILKNLVRAGALEEVPRSLTAKRYLEIEEKFQAFSQEIGIPMDELDLVFWSMETGEILK